jgi:Phasin protein/Domain of unknown function (DUF3597)
MSILGTIMSKVLGKAPASPAAAAPAAPSAQASGTTNAAPSAPAPTSSSAPLGPSVDVAAVLDALSDKKLRSSIGDTPKLDWSSFTAVLQAIFTEGADYTKKEVETRLTLGEKLLGAKSLETVIQIQSDYAKTAYAAFVAQATKMGELHSSLAKAAFKPVEQAITAMQGIQGTK